MPTCKELRALMSLRQLRDEILLLRCVIYECEEKSKEGPGWHNYGKMITKNMLRAALDEYEERARRS
jgi:hypothetical protein